MDAPNGFSPWTHGGSPVTAPWEPIYENNHGGAVWIGTHIRDPHRNKRGLLHGGVIAALCDIAMGHSCGAVLRQQHGDLKSLLTTHLALDYIAKSESGWLEIRPRVVHAGRNGGVVDAIVFVDDRIVARANAAFRPLFEGAP